MANHTYSGAVTGVLNTAGNWDAIPDAVQGVLIFDAVQNAPAGYADGTAPATAMTINGQWGLSLLGGANLILTDILGDLDYQVIDAVTLVTSSIYRHDSVENITGNVSLNDSVLYLYANADIDGTVTLAATSMFDFESTGDIAGAVTVNASTMNVGVAGGTLGSTLDLIDSFYTNRSTGTITGAVTVDATSTYAAEEDQTLTGGVTVTGGNLRVDGAALTSAVDMAGGTLTLIGTGEVVGAVTGSVDGCVIALGTAGDILGTLDMGLFDCTYTGIGTLTVNATSDLVLSADGAAAVGLAINIEGTGITVTAGGAAISCGTLTLTEGTYVAALTHTVATNQVLTVAGTSTLTLTDAGLHVQIAAAAITCTLGGALACNTLRIETGATLDADSNSLTLASGRIHGYGTLTNLTPAGVIHVAPGIIDGGGNDSNVIFDSVRLPLVI